MKKETEIKFILASEEFRALTVSPFSVEEYSLGKIAQTQREFLYYDTFNLQLRYSGITVSLRLREQDCVLAYKIPTNEPSTRNEEELILGREQYYQWNTLLPREGNIGTFLASIYALTKDQSLSKILTASVHNTRIPIYKSGSHVLELTLSEFTGTDGRKKARLYEAEVELQPAGTERDLGDFCNKFQQQFSVERTALNKYQRMLTELMIN